MHKTGNFDNSGQKWKANEALQGRLSSRTYQPKLLEEYGRLLLSMNDDVEAGKYLFLSGQRSSEYVDSIDLFLGKYKGKNQKQLFYSFPRMVKYTEFKELPLNLQQELSALGIRPWSAKRPRKIHLNKSVGNNVAVITFFIVLIVFFVGVFSGINTIWHFLVN